MSKYQLIHEITNKLAKSDKFYNKIFAHQVKLIISKMCSLAPLTIENASQISNLELLVKNWKVENAIRIADSLDYECFNTKTKEQWKSILNKDLPNQEILNEGLDALEDDKYYRLKDILYFSNSYKKENFEEYTNEQLLKCIAKNFNYRLFQGMYQNTLDMLREENSNE